MAALKVEHQQRRAAAHVTAAPAPGDSGPAPGASASTSAPQRAAPAALPPVEIKPGVDCVVPPGRKRSSFLPRITVDSDALVVDLLKQISNPGGAQIIIVRGEDGSGRSTALRRVCAALEENYAPYFSRETPGVRRIAVLACDQCNEVTATDPAAPSELICEPVRCRRGGGSTDLGHGG